MAASTSRQVAPRWPGRVLRAERDLRPTTPLRHDERTRLVPMPLGGAELVHPEASTSNDQTWLPRSVRQGVKRHLRRDRQARHWTRAMVFLVFWLVRTSCTPSRRLAALAASPARGRRRGGGLRPGAE